jgi:cytochrome P450
MVQANGTAGDADLLSTMIEGSASADDGDQGLIDNLFVFFFAGFDTSSVALAFAIWEISQRPLVEKKLLDEIHEVLCVLVQLHHYLFRALFPFPRSLEYVPYGCG